MGYTLEGGCGCGQVRYRMTSRPLIVHACHCRWCQRETGSAFALNAMIESDRLLRLAGEPEPVVAPSESGRGQMFLRCPRCCVAVWSHYGGAGPSASFVRVGTLDNPDAMPPDVHIFTVTRQPWLTLDGTVPAFEQFYDRERIWSVDSLRRREALLPLMKAWNDGGRQWPAPQASASAAQA